jgi:signal transduction histidine kinase
LLLVDWSDALQYRAVVDFRLRNLIGFPAAILTACGFWAYARTVQSISRKGARSFAGAGAAVAVYGILTGLIPSGSLLPLINVPIELLRGLTAFVILHFLMRALQTFDVARKMQIEESLARFAQSEKLHSLGRLAFGIAHEINTPLANISIGFELLKMEVGGNQQYEGRFARIERNLERAKKISQELLHFSTNRDVELFPTDLNEVIESTLHLLGSRRQNYIIETRLNPLPDIMGIPWKLEEVLLNLVINAMDALPMGGEIIITSKIDDGQIVVEVCDDGAGVPAEHLNNVFDPFFTTKEIGKGTGLGLSICYGIMEMHAGQIDMQSTPGKGTCVSLTFPRGENR